MMYCQNLISGEKECFLVLRGHDMDIATLINWQEQDQQSGKQK